MLLPLCSKLRLLPVVMPLPVCSRSQLLLLVAPLSVCSKFRRLLPVRLRAAVPARVGCLSAEKVARRPGRVYKGASGGEQGGYAGD